MTRPLTPSRGRAREKELQELQRKIEYTFKIHSLLDEALTHRSFINESRLNIPDNERLEYLGDSVLALVINEYLFRRFPSSHEGELAKIKAKVVSEETLAKVARELAVGEYLLLGKGEENTGGRGRTSILANTIEALIGAIYLDSGLKSARKFVISSISKYIREVQSTPGNLDPKSTLQELIQKKYKEKPEYLLEKETGPDHSKNFEVVLVICGKKVITGSGSSKRRAETDAASKAIAAINEGVLQI